MTLQQIMTAHPENGARVVACALELDSLDRRAPDSETREDLRAAMQAFATLAVANQLLEARRS